LSRRPMLPILILCAGSPLLHAQSIVEHGIIDGKTAAAAAGAGASVLGVLRQMGNATDAAAKVGTPAPVQVAPPPRPMPISSDDDGPRGSASSTPPRIGPPVSFSVVTAGMDRAELLKIFGKPSMSVSGMESHALTETYWYQTPTESVTVILRDGKVFSITRVEKLAPK